MAPCATEEVRYELIVGVRCAAGAVREENIGGTFPLQEARKRARGTAQFSLSGANELTPAPFKKRMERDTPGFGPSSHGTRGSPWFDKPLRLFGERFYASCFVFFHIEDGVELGDLQQVVHFLGEVEQFEFAALVLGRGEGADEFADA